jgi:hypothetical protein
VKPEVTVSAKTLTVAVPLQGLPNLFYAAHWRVEARGILHAGNLGIAYSDASPNEGVAVFPEL